MNKELSSKEIVNLIYNYRLSIECDGSWFMVYQGDRPEKVVKTGLFTKERQLDRTKILAYELGVTDAVQKAVSRILKDSNNE